VIETEIRNNNTDAITVLHSLDDKLIGGVTVETHYGDVIDHLSLAIASNASYETVQVLCDLVDVNTVSSWNKSTPMHKACYHHRYNVLQLLISRGATAVASTWAGWYPYHTAIMRYYQDTAPKYMHSDARATAKLAVQRYVHEQHAKGLCVNVAVAKRPRRHGGHYTDTMQQLTAQLLTEAITALTTATAGVSGACYAAAAAVAPSGAIDAAAAAASSADAAANSAAAVASSNSELPDVTLQQLYTPVPDVLSQDDDASGAISYINDAGYESNTDILQDIFEHDTKRQRVADS
jgi:ankyrin repeat protein